MAEASNVRKPLALGHAKEPTLFKMIPNKAILGILERYVKTKTGKLPRQVDTFSGIILETVHGKIFFKDGHLEFEASPFSVKKVKNWLPEMKQVLKAYAGKLFLEAVKEKLSQKYKVLRTQEVKQGLVLELVDSQVEDKKFQVIATPTGRVMIFAGNKQADGALDEALNIVNYLQSEGLLDF